MLRSNFDTGHDRDPTETAGLALKQIFEIARHPRQRNSSRASRAAAPEISSPMATGGAARRLCPLRADPNTTVLAEHLSLPLIESVRLTNKVSQNLHAELLLRAVGLREERFWRHRRRSVGGTGFSEHLSGVADGDVVLSDGSGLARDDLVTPRATVAALALRRAAALGIGLHFHISGGRRRTERSTGRMLGTAAAGRIFAKTGETGSRPRRCPVSRPPLAASIWFSPCSAITTRSVLAIRRR